EEPERDRSRSQSGEGLPAVRGTAQRDAPARRVSRVVHNHGVAYRQGPVDNVDVSVRQRISANQSRGEFRGWVPVAKGQMKTPRRTGRFPGRHGDGLGKGSRWGQAAEEMLHHTTSVSLPLAFPAAQGKQGTTDTPDDQELLSPQPHHSR